MVVNVGARRDQQQRERTQHTDPDVHEERRADAVEHVDLLLGAEVPEESENHGQYGDGAQCRLTLVVGRHTQGQDRDDAEHRGRVRAHRAKGGERLGGAPAERDEDQHGDGHGSGEKDGPDDGREQDASEGGHRDVARLGLAHGASGEWIVGRRTARALGTHRFGARRLWDRRFLDGDRVVTQRELPRAQVLFLTLAGEE